MNKVAYYEQEIMEKIATRAWKKHYGELSSSSKKKLVDSGIHNYQKELKGLEKGTKEILRKNNASISRNPITRGVATVRQVLSEKHPYDKLESLKANVRRVRTNPDGITLMNVTDPKKGRVNIKFKDKDHIKHTIGSLEQTPFALTAHNLKKRYQKMSDLEKRYTNALYERHEADEVRAMRAKNNLHTDAGWAQRYRGHASKTVPYRESVNVAIAPKNTQRFMKTLRHGTGEIIDFNSAGLRYGKDAIINKKLMKQAQKPHIE